MRQKSAGRLMYESAVRLQEQGREKDAKIHVLATALHHFGEWHPTNEWHTKGCSKWVGKDCDDRRCSIVQEALNGT